jgi:hypothetical protein
MRFLMIVKSTKESEAGQPPDPRLMAKLGESAKELTQAGVMIYTGGLAPSSTGTRIRTGNGQLTQIDGPFAESTELVGGFAIFEVKSKEEAVQHGRRFMALHQEILGPGYEGELEIRQMFSHDDQPAAKR